PRRAAQPGRLLRAGPPRTHRAHRRADRLARPHRRRLPLGAAALGRPEATPRRRARARARTRGAVPRRALHRSRPAEPRQPLGARLDAARPARHHRLPHHALPRGGRPLRRAGDGDGQRPGHRRRHRSRPQGRPGGRRHHARARRRDAAAGRALRRRAGRGGERGAAGAAHPRVRRAVGLGAAADAAARARPPRRPGGDRDRGAADARRRLPRPARALPARGRRTRRHRRGRTGRARRPRDHRHPRARGEHPMTTAVRTRVVRPHLARDTWHVLVRELKPVLRDPFSLIFSLLQPLVFLGLFGPLLVAQSGGDLAGTLQWFVPGVLVMIVLFGTGATGSNLQYEMMTGSHERTLVAPLSRSSLLVGRALKEIAPIVVQGLAIVAIALPFGYRADAFGLLLGLALLAVFGVGLGALSYALALATKEHEWLFWGVQQSLIF